jgi:hypothetical protein
MQAERWARVRCFFEPESLPRAGPTFVRYHQPANWQDRRNIEHAYRSVITVAPQSARLRAGEIFFRRDLWMQRPAYVLMRPAMVLTFSPLIRSKTMKMITSLAICLLASALHAPIATAQDQQSAARGPVFNGTTLNGFTLNGLTLNGFSLNGVAFNGITLNGLTLNGLTLNGWELNGLNLNGFTVNGWTLNGLTLNGLRYNGITLNGPGLVLQGITLNGPGIVVQGLGFNGISMQGPILQGTTLNGSMLGGRSHSPLSGIAAKSVRVQLTKR